MYLSKKDEGTLAFVRSEFLVIKEKINSLLLKIDVGLGFRVEVGQAFEAGAKGCPCLVKRD